MALLGGSRRRRVQAAYDALYDAIAAADGASTLAAENVRRRHLAALVELWLRESGLDRAADDPALRGLLTNPTFASIVRAIEADRAAGARSPAEELPKLDRIVALAAPGSASLPPDMWLGKPGDHRGAVDVPQLWRMGTGRLGPGGRPFEVALPLLDESHLQISAHPDARAAALGMVENLLLRLVGHFRPGMVALHLWDVEHLTGPLPRLHPLTRSGILHVHDPVGLQLLLDELSDRIRRVHREVLAAGETTLARLAAHTGERSEPWVVAVLVGNRRALRDEEHRALGRIARGGLACGVQLVLVDVPMAIGAPVETLDFADTGLARCSLTGPYVQVEPEERFPADLVTDGCHAIAAEHENWRSRVGTFDDLLPGPGPRSGDSRDELRAPVGFDDGGQVELVLDDSSPHALVGGPSGSGKTNLLLAWIAALTWRYPPDELALYLLDFKEGVSFIQLRPGGTDATPGMPHARLIGINVNDDREFGLALLQYLSDEMRRRAAVAKEHEVTKLADLRDVLGEGHGLPRIVAVIDEFQYLFVERDAVSRAALTLLEDIARRGRSQGIHLVLASQDVSGIDAFWGRPAIFEQFVLRLALPRARRVLDERNEAPLELPRWHAVVNHESGLRHANRVARIPNASAPGLLRAAVQRRVPASWREGAPPPRLFDGSRAPSSDELVAGIGPGDRRAPVGQIIDMVGSPAVVDLPDAPGRNLAVLGADATNAKRVLATAAAGLAAGYAAGDVTVVLAPLVREAEETAGHLAKRFADQAVREVRLAGVRGEIEDLAARTQRLLAAGERENTVLVLFAADAADALLERPGTEALRTLVHFGPETGLHVLGWWRSAPRLKALLMMGAVVDDVGAWVALDVQGTELQPFLPGTMLTWSPRPRRALYFDRAQHALPQVIVVPGDEPS